MLDEKEKVNIYISLYKQQMEHYHKTQNVEWKANIGIWTLLAIAAYTTSKESLFFPLWFIALILLGVIIVHALWLFALHQSEEFDKNLWATYRNKVLLLIGPETQASPALKRTLQKEAYWLLTEVGLTFILSIVVIGNLFWSQHTPTTQSSSGLAVQDTVAIQVRRGSESWQFFAFIFATLFGLSITIFDEYKERLRGWPVWVILTIKVFLFVICFYFIMLNNTVHNGLIRFLNWMVTEHYAQVN